MRKVKSQPYPYGSLILVGISEDVVLYNSSTHSTGAFLKLHTHLKGFKYPFLSQPALRPTSVCFTHSPEVGETREMLIFRNAEHALPTYSLTICDVDYGLSAIHFEEVIVLKGMLVGQHTYKWGREKKRKQNFLSFYIWFHVTLNYMKLH